MHIKFYKLRPAVAMIELIFAMVIIGITLMSAPTIISVSTKSSNVAMQQEAIAAASSQISLVMTRHWDESDSNATTGYGILQVTSQGDRNMTNFTHSRRYNVNAAFRQATLVGAFTSDTDSASHDDIDDFNGEKTTLQLYASEDASFTNNEGEYIDKDGIYTTTTVGYGNDVANYNIKPIILNNPFKVSTSTSSNIKTIRVRLQTKTIDAELAKDVSLYAFSCNIGTPNAGVISFP